MLTLIAVVIACVVQVALCDVCPEYSKNGCGGCVDQTWLDGIKHCGWCNDKSGACMDGGSDGPFAASCTNWEWYGSGGAPGGQCCGSVTNCTGCGASKAGCAWCDKEAICVEKATVPVSFCNRTTKCCSSLSSCSACQKDSTCGWCGSTNSCVTTEDLPQCVMPADAQCCNIELGCADCGKNAACNWCDAASNSSSVCAPLQSCSAETVPDPTCCSDKSGCTDCNAEESETCGWCLATQQCTPKLTTSPVCAVSSYSDVKCCNTEPSCSACATRAKECSFCRFPGASNLCLPADQECTLPADPSCCNVVQGAACGECVSLPGCNYCPEGRKCAVDNTCSASVAIRNSTRWQCDNSLLINCESQTACGPCVGAPGCVWIANAWINGEPLADGLCYTGGLFSLSNDQRIGFVVTAPLGWNYSSCSISALNIVIIGSTLISAAVLAAAIVVCLCIRWRRKKRARGAGGDGYTVNDSTALLDPAPIIGGEKKRVAKAVVYKKPADSVRATDTAGRYQRSRK